MAVVKLAAPLAGIRGTIAGLTYSANGSSLYVKPWAKGSNPKTPKQTTERSFLAQMPQLWAALSDAQRAAWRTFAADPAQELTNSLGESYFASGFNWFCKCNIRLLRVGRSTIQAIPTQARPASPTISGFTIQQAGTDPNVAVGGVASASTFTPGFPASNAFDGATTGRWQSLAPNTTGWLQYIMPTPRIITRYSIYGDTIAASRNPKDWTFERLDPGPTWVPIDTVTNAVLGDFWVTFFATNTVASDTYRLNISANNGHPSLVQVFEMEYFESASGASCIHYPVNEFINSPDYDLILKVSQGQTAARFVQYPGFAEIVATQSPGNNAEFFQDEIEDVYGTILDNRSWFARLYRQTQEGIRSAPAAERTVTE